jgi:hypothetical protein
MSRKFEVRFPCAESNYIYESDILFLIVVEFGKPAVIKWNLATIDPDQCVQAVARSSVTVAGTVECQLSMEEGTSEKLLGGDGGSD